MDGTIRAGMKMRMMATGSEFDVVEVGTFDPGYRPCSELKAGEKLPTVRDLALEMGINTMTVSKAYQLLKTEGYIMTDRKNGARIRTEIKKEASVSDANKTELRRIVSEARISGVEKQELIDLIDKYWEGGND